MLVKSGRPHSLLGTLGLEFARGGLPIAFDFALALEGVALDFALVLDGELVAIYLGMHCEGHVPILIFGVFDLVSVSRADTVPVSLPPSSLSLTVTSMD